jgi:hypothetical protein
MHSLRDAPDAKATNAMACLWLKERKIGIASLRCANTAVVLMLIILVARCI